MEFATEALGNLLPKLAQLLQDEYNLQTGAKKDIEFLSSELETIHAALCEVGEVPREQLGELQRIWARDVREMSYDMEDIVDAFMVRVQGPEPHSKSSPGQTFSLKYMIQKFTTFMARREVAQEINNIKVRARELAKRRDRHKFDAIVPANKTAVDPRMTAMYTKVTELVGIGEAKEEVIARLTLTRCDDDDHKERIVVSIAGFGGLGKTTLARAVYDEIKQQFGCTAFVSVSRNPDMKKLLKDILYGLDSKDKFKDIHSKMLDETQLIDLIHEFLKNRRYLIVIDDIWDKESWDKVTGLALMENNMRSRIITTTRIIGVAKHIGGCYRLKPLSDESSEILFYGRIFGSKDQCPRQFSEVSKSILKKCGGVPLAIVTTSSLLANKSEDIRAWNDVCSSIGSGLRRNNPGMDDMRKILSLSYYDLPSHLKTCLLYLSVFPEDYEIRKDRLIRRWVAEGFVQQDQQAGGDEISFLGIGENYFDELLSRSLIQPADMDGLEGIPKACRLHDTVLDLIITLSVEERFITTVLGDGMESKVRWLSLHSSNTTWPTTKMPKLRSLTIFRPDDVAIDLTHYSCYRLLRVLDLEGCSLEGLESLGCLGSLSHLRYLGVSSTRGRSTIYYEDGDKLPVEIGKLRFLQTLDISTTAVRELPSSVIEGLGQLMCLRGTSRYRVKLPVGLKNLTSLEVLESGHVASERIAEELGHLTKLRILEVCIDDDADDENWTLPRNRIFGFLGELSPRNFSLSGKALVQSLGKLAKIESLDISANRDDPYLRGTYYNLDGPMEEPLLNMWRLRIDSAMFLPTWIRPDLLPSLSCVDVTVTYERQEDIQVLGTLRWLRHLKFATMEDEFVGAPPERCVVGPDAFPRAVRCEFDTRIGLAPSMFPRGAMPELQDLTFCMGRRGCISVDDLGLGHLPSLRRVAVRFVEFTFDDYDKVISDKLEHEAAVHPNHPSICFPDD